MRWYVRFLAALVLFATAAGPVSAANPRLKEIEDEFIRLGEQIRTIVVNVHTKGPAPGEPSQQQMEGLEELFRQFGMPAPGPNQGIPMPRPEASGSGFIYDKTGHIITNNHVVEDAESIEVRLWNGHVLQAEVIGADPQTDLAVIKIDTEDDLPTAILGDSDAVRVGQFAIAVGNPRQLEGSLSYGHVTALGRQGLSLPGLRFQDLIQTDAAINLGNSGGPLCDIDGRVIGINTAIVFGADSLGFAVPINRAKKVIPVLISEGKVIRGYLGVEIRDAETIADALDGLPDSNGAFVENVVPDTPAAAAGLKVYDVIRKVNGEAILTAQDLINHISDQAPDAAVFLEVWRDGQAIEVQVQLDEFPDSLDEATRPKAILGIRVMPLTDDLVERLGLESGTHGVLVAEVEPGSPAADARIQHGDVILDVAMKPLSSVDEFNQAMQDNAIPGQSLLLRVVRGPERPRVIKLTVPKDKVEE